MAEKFAASKPESATSSLEDRNLQGLGMSLKTRESSSIALKRIFDQINSNGDNFEAHSNSVANRTLPLLEGKDGDGNPSRGQASSTDKAGSEERCQELSLLKLSDDHQLTDSGVPPLRGMCSPWNQSQDEGGSLSLKKFLDLSGEEGRNLECDGRSSTTHRLVDAPTSPALFTMPHGLPSNYEGGLSFQTPELNGSPALQTGRGIPSSIIAETDGGPADHLYNPFGEHPNVGPKETLDHLRKRLPELDLSFRRNQSHDPVTAFGSPIHFLSLGGHHSSSEDVNNVSPPAQKSAQGTLPAQGARIQPNPVALLRPGSSVGRQSTAQLTIFYSGKVNVYDNVPADKAHAIMLLAGSGKSLSSPQLTSGALTEKNASIPSCTTATAATADLSDPASILTAKTVAYSSSMKIPTSSMSVVPPLTYRAEMKQPPARLSHAELPVARKASLARFLEKRRERVVQDKIASKTIDMCSQTQDISITPEDNPGITKRRCSRSPSPSPPTNRPRCSLPSPLPSVRSQT